MKKSILSLAIVAAMGTGVANASPVAFGGGVFTMYSPGGLDTTPTNMTGSIGVDTTISGWIDQSVGTWGVSSTQPFFGLNWTASGGTLITMPGNYALNTSTGAITSGTGPVANDGTMYFTVGAGQAAGAINFAWYTTTNIRVVDVWNINVDGSLTAVAVPGMENGPFSGYNAAFNLNAPVPVPATAWLFGSGLLGLAGIARKRKTT